jgi:hypothetical protein
MAFEPGRQRKQQLQNPSRDASGIPVLGRNLNNKNPIEAGLSLTANQALITLKRFRGGVL